MACMHLACTACHANLLPSAIASCAITCLILGCPSDRSEQPEAVAELKQAQPAGAAPQTEADKEYARGLELSLFAGTPLELYLPDSVAYSRDGSRIFFHGLNKDSGLYYAVGYSIGAGKLVEGAISYPDKELFVPRIAAQPAGKEVLVASQWQPTPKHIRDVLWRIGPEIPGLKSGVPYDRAEGMPADGPHDTWMELSPFYSWDGASIIVPLNHLGLIVSATATGSSRYSPYPALPFTVTGQAFGPLPDEGDGQRIWASFWEKGATSDKCEVWLLDLDKLHWEKMFTLAWIAYEVGVSQIYDEPWLVAGSRSPFETTSSGQPLPAPAPGAARRVPRLALVVPRAQTEQILELHGEPVWDIALEPRGRYACYMDRQRRGIVRLEPATGKLDLDSRFYCGDDRASLSCGDGGDHVYYWYRGIFVEAQWDKHEDHPGFERAPEAEL